ncbi:MAG: amidohydrolase [Flavobacteriaceae bacterium]|nr:MAG: amidohydrolase [Flavobacteriaceae bacterium]
MIIDSHQHFWKYDSNKHQWIGKKMQTLRKNFLPEELEPLLLENNIDGCIAVQAVQSEEETHFLLALANEHSFIKGVVGWVDLCAEDIEDRLKHFSKNTILKGIRHVLEAENLSFMSKPSFLNGIRKLKEFNLTYDILIDSTQLTAAEILVSNFPNQAFVIDHIAKPNIKNREFEKWATQISLFGKHKNVCCKISGLVTQANWNNWSSEQIIPYLDHIFHVFGIDRIMYGSDWPVCLLSSTYKEQLNIVQNYISIFSIDDQKRIMRDTAVRFYRIKK